MSAGWDVAELEFQELAALIAEGFCRSRRLDPTKLRIRVGINAGHETVTATIKWRERESE